MIPEVSAVTLLNRWFTFFRITDSCFVSRICLGRITLGCTTERQKKPQSQFCSDQTEGPSPALHHSVNVAVIVLVLIFLRHHSPKRLRAAPVHPAAPTNSNLGAFIQVQRSWSRGQCLSVCLPIVRAWAASFPITCKRELVSEVSA